MSKVRNISHMWTLLDVYTHDQAGNQRSVNHLNEWGGYSRALKMPVFTAWLDRTTFDRTNKMTSAVVASKDWQGKAGVNNQERWVDYAIAHDGDAAFFVIHAVDVSATPRSIADIDADRVVVGKIRREGSESIVTGQPRLISR